MGLRKQILVLIMHLPKNKNKTNAHPPKLNLGSFLCCYVNYKL